MPVVSLLSVHDPAFATWSLRGIWDYAREGGWAGQLPPATRTPGVCMSYLDARSTWLAAKQATRSGLAFESGRRKGMAELGALAGALRGCPTLGEAVQLALRFQRAAGAVAHLELRCEGAHAILHAEPLFDDPELEPVWQVDHLLTVWNAARQLLEQPDLAPERVVVRGQVAPRSAMQAYWRAPVDSGSSASMLIFPRSWLGQRLPGTPGRVVPTPDLQDDPRISLLRWLHAQNWRGTQAGELACALAMSERSLYRFLAREGLRFQHLSDRWRGEEAMRRLQIGEPTEQIAVALGYADARSFRRAFLRMFGCTPTMARAAFSQ